MKKILLFFSILVEVLILQAQSDGLTPNLYSKYFQQAYKENPSIPRGILEAVAYTNTHFRHIDEKFAPSCTGMPKYWGVMGLIDNGKGYFKENLKLVAKLSGYKRDKIKHDPKINILAYARAFAILSNKYGIKSQQPADYIPVLRILSEIPYDSTNATNDFALNSFLYSILNFLSSPKYTNYYKLPHYNIDLEKIFGENYKILSAKKVIINDVGIFNEKGDIYSIANQKTPCPDYNVSYCSWVASPNYSSRDGTPISALVIHTTQGSYAGTIAWFQNPDANASAHYVLRSSDGQITQMVREADKAWHVRTENPYTIGYEHEGYVEEPSWYTQAMYQSSALLARHDCDTYGINPHRMFYRDTLDDGTVLDSGVHVLAGQNYCTKIAGHQHYPNNSHVDPGPYWNWNYYYRLVNQGLGTVINLTDTAGTFYDSGGPNGNYGNDERIIWVIHPPNASKIVLTFNNFSLEDNYDFLYIYDGDNVFAPLIGRWNTQSPGTIISTGGALTIEFRSDCATTDAGWSATWHTIFQDTIPPSTQITTSGGVWKTHDFYAYFNDNDNSGIDKTFYQVIETDGNNWFANTNNGFFADNFDNMQAQWTAITGNWYTQNSFLVQDDENSSNTNIYAYLNQNNAETYLYHFQAIAGGSGNNRRFGFHFFCDSAQLTNRGNSYFVWFRIDDQNLQFYKVINDTFHLMYTVPNIITEPGRYYDYKIIYNANSGKTDVYRDNILLASYTYPNPLQQGKYISFRTGNATLEVDNIKVYHSRSDTMLITVGNEAYNDIQVQNFDTSYCAKIKSIVVDASGNLSPIAYYNLKIDYTPPSPVNVLDGLQQYDIDTLENSNTLSAHWSHSIDPNSDIAAYWYSVGTSPGDSNIIQWTNNGLDTSIIINNLDLQLNTAYYFNVKAQNNAGLYSTVSHSDGAYILGSIIPSFYCSDSTICTEETIHFTNTSQNATSYKWYFEGGEPQISTETNPDVLYHQPGTYSVKLTAYNGNDSAVYQANNLITVYAPPIADFTVSDTLLYLPNAIATFTNLSQNATNYLWDFGDGVISELENPQHLYTTTGYYDVSLTASNPGCPQNTKTYENIIHVLLAQNVEITPKAKVFPNPFREYFIIEAQSLQNISLIGSDGKIYHCKIEAKNGKFLVKPMGMTSGLYILHLYFKDGKDVSVKLIKR